jgi:hypothetical protein
VSLINSVGHPPSRTVIDEVLHGLELEEPTPKICKFPVTPEIKIFTFGFNALNLNHAELFCAAFHEHPTVFGLYKSVGWAVKPLFEATMIWDVPRQ